MSEMITFDDLAKDTPFSFKGVTYIIPAITNEKAVELFKMGRSEEKSTFDSADLGEKEEKETDPDFQFKFVSGAIYREDGEPFTREEYNKWPMRVTLAVTKLINDCISKIDEDSSIAKK
jgi:hypothetical protein